MLFGHCKTFFKYLDVAPRGKDLTTLHGDRKKVITFNASSSVLFISSFHLKLYN